MWKEFKEFALKGNIVDMAIGVIIGGAFQKIVTSLVNDIIMPMITFFTGKVDFSDLVINIGNTSIKYGNFLTTIIDFLIVALSIFIAIRTITKLNDKTKENLLKLNKKSKKKPEEVEEVVEPTTKVCQFCYSEISYKATRCPHCTSELKEEKRAKTKTVKAKV